ncbi:unnamed protein product [Kuraishia capsulata CBS 1993]|uniref:Fcf2 pre-rRNA processing C-terminal domain-containing protein n=1 Tax=Kuraishia capsulata CBS 1993 TaxID=1382522 RepID=W6MLQ6_9ASCO|nr:uncharacterized protein KUCA_T00003414001 [Kuraishia capsulata CBS 1993]CDK27436.1 unnamed protein product [Kuraishia capsulata CBS 1993]
MATKLRSNAELEKIREEAASPDLGAGISLADLFEELKEELKPVQNTTTTKPTFEQIQHEVNNVPSLDDFEESSLKTKSSTRANSRKVRIQDDPVIKQRAAKEDHKQKGAGSKWFNMPKTEITPEIKRDLMIIQNRAALDPKRFYKKDKWKVPEHFQMGTLLSNADGVIEGRSVGRAKGKGLIDEIIHDDQTQKYFKRRYQEIQEKATSGRKDHYRKLKQQRKKF